MTSSTEAAGLPTTGRSARCLPFAFMLAALGSDPAAAAQIVIDGPPGSGAFGRGVISLPNGYFVIADPDFDAPGPMVDVGAVYLYRPDGILVSTLRGTHASDQVGSNGVVVLANGNFVVSSPRWDNGFVDVGAVTFGSMTAGVDGAVTPDNSLVGGKAGDSVGSSGVTALANGNYVVQSGYWDNGPVVDAGAATFSSGTTGITGQVSPGNSLVGSSEQDALHFAIALANGNYVVLSPGWDNGTIRDAGTVAFGSGTTGISGAVSAENSLVGGTEQDRIGENGVRALRNGNYVVVSPNWNNGAAFDVGAVTFGSGTTGITGLVSPQNSLIGGTEQDRVGDAGVYPLTNGNYVVLTPYCALGGVYNAGAATFGSGTSGISGVISPTNSLVGSSTNDAIGSDYLTILANGNYVVRSPTWSNGAATNAGAATFGSGDSGISGVVSPANSLVGTNTDDAVSSDYVIALTNGNYVVASSDWRNGAAFRAGAVTFGSGTNGISGAVSAANSLVGSNTGDRIGGSGVRALSNGNYVVRSERWRNDAVASAGAVTFGSGSSGISGAVSSANSLVGSTAFDRVGADGVTALTNGNYVVESRWWDNGPAVDAGAVTFGSGTTGISGVVSPANSLVGSSAGDSVGLGDVAALPNGDYVVASPQWRAGAGAPEGAVTYGSGISGISGLISPINSLVGGSGGDRVGSWGVTALSNGNYVVHSANWQNGAIVDAGAMTLGLSNGTVSGAITEAHSVLGLVSDQGPSQVFSYDARRNQLAVGQPASNRVVLQRTGIATMIFIVSEMPDPSVIGHPVLFTAALSASPGAPTDGQVNFTASSGESCVDTTPMRTSAQSVDFSCEIVFSAPGVSTVVAEFVGSIVHAYSGSSPKTHTALDARFADGFETP